MEAPQTRINEGLLVCASSPFPAQLGQGASPQAAQTQAALSLRPQRFDDEPWGHQGEWVLELSSASHQPPRAQSEELGQYHGCPGLQIRGQGTGRLEILTGYSCPLHAGLACLCPTHIEGCKALELLSPALWWRASFKPPKEMCHRLQLISDLFCHLI